MLELMFSMLQRTLLGEKRAVDDRSQGASAASLLLDTYTWDLDEILR
jgi:hypothetical protein